MSHEIFVLDFIWPLIATGWWDFLFLARVEADIINFHNVFLCRWVKKFFFPNPPFYGTSRLSKVLGFVGIYVPASYFVELCVLFPKWLHIRGMGKFHQHCHWSSICFPFWFSASFFVCLFGSFILFCFSS